MEGTYASRYQSIRRSTPDWILIGLRLMLAALVAKPALSKFLTYGNSVAFFDTMGIPTPELMVIIAGIIEVGAVVLLLIGIGERLAVFSLIPVMFVAILYVGPDWKNLCVLIGSLIFMVLETEPDSFWQFARQLPG